jgi:hypothetical protein
VFAMSQLMARIPNNNNNNNNLTNSEALMGSGMLYYERK